MFLLLYISYFCSLSPLGESGLKFNIKLNEDAEDASLPAWGEWIEIGALEAEFL